MAIAFTEPISASARALAAGEVAPRRDSDSAVGRRGSNRRSPDRAAGAPGMPTAPSAAGASSTQGASIIGSVSEEIEPSVVSTRGDSAKAAAAMTREPREPMPSTSHSRITPQNPARISSAHQIRCVIQAGMPRTCPSEKNAPCGKK